MSECVIKIENGVPRNPEWRMAEPVNLEILEGEHIAIFGDNASGKSRLVEIITQHYPLLGDGIRFNFETEIREVDERTGVKRLVSEQIKYITFRDSYGDQDGTYYYQQRWNQHDIDDNTPTVGDLLERIPEQHNGLRQKLYKMFDLEYLLDKYIISLSSGELRKFQLTKTLLSNPRILIMDNPFIGLDNRMRAMLKDILTQITRESKTMIFLVLNRSEEIPEFITHIIQVQHLTVLPKISRDDFVKQQKNYICNTSVITLPATEEANCRIGDADVDEIIRFNNVTIRYGSRTILKNLNWDVREGERWALKGENGSGKSTLLSLVCADNPQSYANDIELFGNRRGSGESIWEIKRHIGYVSPEMHRAYHKDMPAIDIVASGLNDSIGLYCKPKPGQKETCAEWMKVFGIEKLQNKTFLKLSSGEQRLCLLARAFVKDPYLLILDEPLHGLDAKNREMVREIIRVFCQRPHKTLIMVTHYDEELPEGITDELVLKKTI